VLSKTVGAEVRLNRAVSYADGVPDSRSPFLKKGE